MAYVRAKLHVHCTWGKMDDDDDNNEREINSSSPRPPLSDVSDIRLWRRRYVVARRHLRFRLVVGGTEYRSPSKRCDGRKIERAALLPT